MEHAFGSGRPFSVGVEEELFLVDPGTLGLAHVAEDVLPRIEAPPGTVDHEAFACELELRSPPCPDAGEAVSALREARLAAGQAGATLMAAGLHPSAEQFEVRLTRKERYARVKADVRSLIERAPECALHVHVGLPDEQTAIHALNALREHLPLLSGLAANSPFWFGRDSGLASSRAAIVAAYPSRGIPPVLRDFGHFEETLAAAVAGGGPTDTTRIWWDVRLQPRLGTVEFRELDVQTDLDDAAAIVALVHALARRGAESPPAQPAAREALSWSCFRAARDGLDAQILHDGRPTPLREAARRALGEVGSDADPAIAGVERILREGGGVAKQRAAHARGGMRALLEDLVARTAPARA